MCISYSQHQIIMCVYPLPIAAPDKPPARTIFVHVKFLTYELNTFRRFHFHFNKHRNTRQKSIKPPKTLKSD